MGLGCFEQKDGASDKTRIWRVADLTFHLSVCPFHSDALCPYIQPLQLYKPTLLRPQRQRLCNGECFLMKDYSGRPVLLHNNTNVTTKSWHTSFQWDCRLVHDSSDSPSYQRDLDMVTQVLMGVNLRNILPWKLVIKWILVRSPQPCVCVWCNHVKWFLCL